MPIAKVKLFSDDSANDLAAAIAAFQAGAGTPAISDQRGAAMAAYYDRSNDKTRVVAGSRRSLDDATLHGVSQGAAIGALGGMLGGHLQGRASPGSSGTAGSIVGGGLAGYLASRGPRGESRPDVHLRIDRGAGETSKLGSEVRSKTAFTLAELLVGGVGGATSGAATAGEGRRLAGAALGAPAGFVGSVFGGSGRSLPRSAVGSVAGGSLAGLAVRKRKKKQATKTASNLAQVHGRANGGTTQASVTAAYNHPERRALRKKLGLPDGHEETMTKFMKKSAFDMGMMAKIAELRSYPIAKAKYHEDPDERAHVSRSIVATLGHLEGRGLLTPAGVKDLNHYRGAGSKDLESHSLFSGQIKPAGIDVAKNMMNDAYRAHRKVALTVLDVAKGGAAIGGTIGAIRGARKAKAEGKSVAGGALKGGAGGALIGGVAVPTAVIGSAIVHSLLRDAAKAK